MNSALQIVPASSFSIQQLTDAYNQTRIDYLVPMPMNAARLAEYVQLYDVDLSRSFVALDETGIIGLAMLGVRAGRAWITRLGVLPLSRRRGQGQALMEALLQAADGAGLPLSILEVIKNNTPAHSLFLKLGFAEINDLLILRRPPAPILAPPAGEPRWLGRPEILEKLKGRVGLPPWTNQTESFSNADQIHGLYLRTPQGTGWAAFMQHRRVLSHIVLQTEEGDPAVVGSALLAGIHHQFPTLDTQTENLATDDPHLPGFARLGYVEAFRRIQMYRRN